MFGFWKPELSQRAAMSDARRQQTTGKSMVLAGLCARAQNKVNDGNLPVCCHLPFQSLPLWPGSDKSTTSYKIFAKPCWKWISELRITQNNVFFGWLKEISRIHPTKQVVVFDITLVYEIAVSMVLINIRKCLYFKGVYLPFKWKHNFDFLNRPIVLVQINIDVYNKTNLCKFHFKR